MKIVNNYEYNSIELYFDGKPSEMIRETLKLFKWRWNSNKLCWYNRNTAENMAVAQSLQDKEAEMERKEVPQEYADKYNQQNENGEGTSAYINNLMNGLYKENERREAQKKQSVSESVPKISNAKTRKIIDIDDDNFELNLD